MIEIRLCRREPRQDLEVGTGCGYQAAVLSHGDRGLFGRAPAPLLDRARLNLRHLRLPNVRLKHADGSAGLGRGGALRFDHRGGGGAQVPPA